ncbi:MAG: MFS transporter [Anaerolineae bacterium]|nr:MFS transporter [Anaerolineae bacterium]
MKRALRWYDYITINSYWFGFNIASATMTPVLLPFLVALYVPAEVKNTYLGNLRVISLAVAMMIQPMAGMLSDRTTHPLGRRRPWIIGGTLVSLLFLTIIGASPSFEDEVLAGVSVAYLVLLLGVVLLQVSSNFALGAVQGLIPDLVPEDQRGRASGVKAVMELLPAFVVIAVGSLVDAGRIWLVIGILITGFFGSMLVTVFGVHEEPLRLARPPGPQAGDLRERLVRLVALAAIFVTVTRAALWMVHFAGRQVEGMAPATVIVVVGLVGLAAMAGSVLAGVYLGARVGIGREAEERTSFIWWVINRLLFLAAVGSIQGFAQYFLSDVLRIENAATTTTLLLAVVAVFLIASALAGGALADRLGHKRLVAWSALIAAAGTLVILFARSVPMVVFAGSIIGIGSGTFMATNWALGTRLAPPAEAGRYLGIANLAGAGAGIVGAGIGGPMADFFNAIEPGLGYLVIFALYGVLFVLSAVTLLKVK